jgi:DNA end-binding protein Ku
MAPIWKGSLTFGLVNIPVQVHSATRSQERISFRLLHATDLSPIKYERVCQAEAEPVAWGEIVKGYEYEKGKFVVLTDDDFKAASLEASKAIDILDFVGADEIDPRYFETPYYLLPARGGEKAYALLREAIRRTGKVGIGKFAMRSNAPHLAAVKVVGDALVLEVMRYADELVDPAEYAFPSADGVRPQELAMAEQLIGNLAEPFDPTRYTDDYRAKLMKIIRAKMKGRKVKFDEPAEPESTQVVDLMARLQASLEQAKPKRRARGGPKDAPGEQGEQRAARTRRRKTA